LDALERSPRVNVESRESIITGITDLLDSMRVRLQGYVDPQTPEQRADAIIDIDLEVAA